VLELRTVPADHPDALRLVREVQQVYVERYGEADLTPMRAAEFAPPGGIFLVGYDVGGVPVACGGWRARDDADPGPPARRTSA